jgi:uncharacterized protein
MTDPAKIRGIFLYPIKSLDAVATEEATVLASGALQHDREFALVDDDGKWINGKRDSRVHRIRTEYDVREYRVTVRSDADAERRRFHLLGDQRQLEEWFSKFFGFRVHIRRDGQNGFPDDLESPGPTIIGSATLGEIASWFDLPGHDEARKRFRPNIEIDTDVAFWEDCLFGEAGEIVPFQIGDVLVHGVNPCQRCVVPSRDSRTGAAVPDFQRLFASKRAATLPVWAAASRFNHYYRVSVNTRIPSSEAGKIVRVGDRVAPELALRGSAAM